ncbi:hypothetical protein ABB02_00119 [Clostridiaceae bacterium JG1575]|nr:hypothetical protein ABB02_00119 [Clostridiaceae bacterium JG1575]
MRRSERLQKGRALQQRGALFALFMVLQGASFLLLPNPWGFLPLLAGWLLLQWAFSPGGYRGVCSLMLVLVLAFPGANLLYMIRNQRVPLKLQELSWVMIPGAGIDGEEPSWALRCRLDAALPILRRGPTLPVIVSGGLGSGEAHTEARVMQRYLTQRGIDPQRILLEEEAKDTIANVQKSKAILSSKGLSGRGLLITNSFHCCRCASIAQAEGLTCQILAAPSPPSVFLYAMLRETGSFLKVLTVYGGALKAPIP